MWLGHPTEGRKPKIYPHFPVNFEAFVEVVFVLFSPEGTRTRQGSPAGVMPIAGVIFSFTNGIIYNLDRGSFDLTGGAGTSWPASLFGQAKYAKTIMKSFPGHKLGSLQEGQGLVMWRTYKRST